MYHVSKEVQKSIFLFVVFFYTENNPQNQIPVKDENVCNGTETALTALDKVLLFFSSRQKYYHSSYPVSILRKSISGRHRPVRVADGPMTARCRFT